LTHHHGSRIPRIVMGDIRALFARKRNRAASAVAGAQRPRPAAVTARRRDEWQRVASRRKSTKTMGFWALLRLLAVTKR